MKTWRRVACLIYSAIFGVLNPTNGPTDVTAQAPPAGFQLSGPPLALKGTALLAHPEKIDGVDGSLDHLIDQNQYAQIENYFLKRIAATAAIREKLWQPDFSTQTAYEASLRAHRLHLRAMLGLIDTRPGTAEVSVLDASGEVRIEEVKIPLDGDFEARALLFVPPGEGRKKALIAIPGAEQTAEEFAGIAEGIEASAWLQDLLARGVEVAVPEMIERRSDHSLCQEAGGHDRRRVLWRLGFLVGRTLVGVEVQQVAALADYLAAQAEIDAQNIGAWGKGQGGMTALYAAALDERLAAATVQDYFEQRENCWTEPVDRVLYGQLNEFGDAEVAALISPRPLSVVTTRGGPVNSQSADAEVTRARRFYQGLRTGGALSSQEVASGAEEFSARQAASLVGAKSGKGAIEMKYRRPSQEALEARNQHFEALYRYLHRLCDQSDKSRAVYWKLESTLPDERAQKAAKLRSELANMMGVIPQDGVPLHPRTLLIGETEQFLAYEVLLDAAPGVEAYGHLLVPRSVGGRVHRRLPAVICQHGFGGVPKFVSGVGTNIETNDHYYHRFGERLAERGYVVFAPYVCVPAEALPPGESHRADLVNPLVRMAAAVGLMRTSIEVAKLHRIIDFLQSLPFVDANRIGYYGLSYGGYSAIWMPPLEPRLRFTIVSGHFNYQRSKLLEPGGSGHLWGLPDEDFYNWNLLNRITHVELVAAMWPRPVSIEWGLGDRTTTPEWHKEAADDLTKRYVIPWNMTDRVMFNDYIGPHTVHGIGTFSFIDRWLRPERSAGRDYGCNGEDYCRLEVAPGLHGYNPSSEVPYITKTVDSTKESIIRGRFYVSNISSDFEGLRLKLSRLGHPGDLVVELGSKKGRDDIGELRLPENQVYSGYALWYELKLMHPMRLDTQKLYWFEVRSATGEAPRDGYVIYGPKPLGGEDYPVNFGLSFRILTENGQ